jgi:hypothetical protein
MSSPLVLSKTVCVPFRGNVEETALGQGTAVKGSRSVAVPNAVLRRERRRDGDIGFRLVDFVACFIYMPNVHA